MLDANGEAVWRQAVIDGPSPRSVAALAFDPDGARLLLFGGANANAFNSDFWALSGPPILDAQTVHVDVCPAETVRFTVTVAGTGQFRYAWEYLAANDWLPINDGEVPEVGVATRGIDR